MVIPLSCGQVKAGAVGAGITAEEVEDALGKVGVPCSTPVVWTKRLLSSDDVEFAFEATALLAEVVEREDAVTVTVEVIALSTRVEKTVVVVLANPLSVASCYV